MIRLVFSSDIPGFGHISTVLASILRRTRETVAARIYTRGFRQASFAIENLSVEFVRSDEPVEGLYPGHVSPAVFDRLRILRDDTGWDRVLVMDHDMLVFRDLAEYFREPFEDAVLMGRLFGEANTLGLQMQQRGGLPASWDHCGEYPYFYMGPMMNLAKMKEEGFWDFFLLAHSAIGQDEQISLTAASRGRIRGVAKHWNLVPQWDHLEEKSRQALLQGTSAFVDGIPWKNGVPAGLIHWTGHAKPWHYQSKVWRADLWGAELSSWEHLRAGLWHKPLALEIEPEGARRVKALLARGWKVHVRPAPGTSPKTHPAPLADLAFPDLCVQPEDGPIPLEKDSPGYDLVRFGPRADLDAWFREPNRYAGRMVLEGPRSAAEIAFLRDAGYLGESRIQRNAWPDGGPHPDTLSYIAASKPLAAGRQEDLYLSRLPSDPPAFRPDPLSRKEEDSSGRSFVSPSSAAWKTFLTEDLPRHHPHPREIVMFGLNDAVECTARRFPDSRITLIHHDALDILMMEKTLRALPPNLRVLHAPLEETLPWYDLSQIPLPVIDVILASCPKEPLADRFRFGSIALKGHLHAESTVLVDRPAADWSAEERDIWTGSGFELASADAPVSRFRNVPHPPIEPFVRRPDCPLEEIIGNVYVISLPQRLDRRSAWKRNWRFLGLDYEWVDAERPPPGSIRWTEMAGLEAHGNDSNLRTEYVVGAVGCKRSGIKALETFLASGAETALICQDDCRWRPDSREILAKAFSQLPQHWDLVYLSSSRRKNHLPYSTHLLRMQGARLCNAVLWRRTTAEALLPRLKECNCEWDVFMESVHPERNVFCVVPMPAEQDTSFSDIVGSVVRPPNR